MSYLRGDFYAWTGGDDDREFVTLHGLKSHCGCGEHRQHPSITLPMEVFDQLVVMRFSELQKDEKWKAAVDSVVKEGAWNFGALELAHLVGLNPVESWNREWEQRHEEHLERCQGDCDSPGYHRFRHHRHKGPEARDA